jgi:hypothetical protein
LRWEAKVKTRQIPVSLAVVAALGAFLSPALARAQDSMLASGVAAESREIAGMKSEDTATLLSLAGTAVPITLGILLANSDDDGGASSLGLALVSYGVYFGPATGYWYAGASGAGLKGTAVRLGISVATVGITAAICSGDACNIFGEDDGATTAAGIVSLVAIGAFTYSMIRDIAGADNQVRRHNAELAASQEQQAPRLTIAPVLSPADGGTVGVFGRLRM